MKKKTKVYISGKITGDKNYKAKFRNAEVDLRACGFKPYNPARLISAKCNWEEAMRKALKLMLKCDLIVLLSDWEQSRGAKIEERLARDLGIPVKTFVQMLFEVMHKELGVPEDDYQKWRRLRNDLL